MLKTLNQRAAVLFLALTSGSVEIARAVDGAYIPRGVKLREHRETALLLRHAPVFIVRENEDAVNRIGTPEIRHESERDRVLVNPANPRIYAEVRRDRLGATPVLQLVYRVHFQAVPFASKVFFEAHRNAGVLAIVTLTERKRQPIFFTTVHTCGCFLALLPTDRVPQEVLPAKWPKTSKRVTGKTLPAVVTYPKPGQGRLVVRLEPKTHRVEHIETTAALPKDVPRTVMLLHSMKELHRLAVVGGGGRRGSFFHTSGPLRGYVRGAWSPIEGLALGVFLLDPMLGSDKDFGDPEITSTRFYTSLWPWERNASRLDRMGVLLEKRRFNLTALPRM